MRARTLETSIERVDVPTRRQTNKRRTLANIETAAWELFCEKGYEATSTRAVAERAKIASGTLFNYFPGKRSLLLHLMRRRLDGAADVAFETLPQGSLGVQLEHIFGHLFAAYGRERRLSRVFVKELLFVDGPLRAETAQWTYALIERIGTLIIRAQQRGELSPHADAMKTSAQIFSAHYFGLVTWLGGTVPSEAARDEHLKSAVSLVLRGLEREAA